MGLVHLIWLDTLPCINPEANNVLAKAGGREICMSSSVGGRRPARKGASSYLYT